MRGISNCSAGSVQRRRRPERAILALALAGAVAAPGNAAMRLAVNTHFGQNWPIGLLAKVEESGAQGIRDSIPWGAIERTPGVYAFTDRNSGYLKTICARGIPVTLMVPPRNTLYGPVNLPLSAAGQAAYGRYVRAVVDRFPCVEAIEVGNEVNAMAHKPWFDQGVKAHVGAIRAARAALAGGRKVMLLGGSSLMIATGFFEKLFAAGMLPLVDGVAVHPYLPQPEAIPAQIARLRAMMAQAGGIKPIFATEFGLFYDSPEAAPPHAARVMAILSAAHVAEADWYALKDEPWYPNMGLYAGQTPKPALPLFRRVAGYLRDYGDAAPVETGDPLVFAYRFGNGPTLFWGSGRAVRFDASGGFVDSFGRAMAVPAEIDGDPFFAPPGARWTLGASRVLADSFYEAGDGAWKAAWVGQGGRERPLDWVDTSWAPHLGVADKPGLIVTSALIRVPGPGGALVEQFTAPAAGPLWLSACLLPAKASPPAITVTVGGRAVGSLSGSGPLPPLKLDAPRGGTITVRYGTSGPGISAVRRRIRILNAAPTGEAECPREAGNMK